jgi:hypothetical protein
MHFPFTKSFILKETGRKEDQKTVEEDWLSKKRGEAGMN